ncbi:hypothetical protein HOG48_01910 [Candidatus Peregrinibacteria bacterium]|jgi:hypothetical protein|nr:hypothetical protein [Candidatus Peregrinibacteria bacterium]
MSDLESFGGLDGGEGLDPAALERFQEQMRDNAAHIAALQKAQAKQKKQEDKLIKIILKFIQTSSKRDLVILVTQLLEQNVPAGFVLSLIMLGNEDIQEAAGVKLSLPEADMERMEAMERAQKGDSGEEGQERGIILFSENISVLPLKIRIGIDLWAKNLLAAGMGNPNKVLDSVYMPGTRGTFTSEDKAPIKEVVVKTATYVINEFVTENKVEGEYGQIYDFAHFLLKGILEKVEESLHSPELRAGEEDRKYEE